MCRIAFRFGCGIIKVLEFKVSHVSKTCGEKGSRLEPVAVPAAVWQTKACISLGVSPEKIRK